MSTPEPILGVIFDLDGTLVDSQLDFEAMRQEMGLPIKAPLLETIATLPAAEADRCWAILERHEQTGAQRATAMPGVHWLLAELERMQLRIAVVTRNGRRFAVQTLDRLGLPYEVLVTRDDAPPKPKPDALLKVLKAWQLPPPRVAMIGDYRFDLEAGCAAGTRTVLYAANRDAEDLRKWGHLADLHVESFEQAEPLLTWLKEPQR